MPDDLAPPIPLPVCSACSLEIEVGHPIPGRPDVLCTACFAEAKPINDRFFAKHHRYPTLGQILSWLKRRTEMIAMRAAKTDNQVAAPNPADDSDDGWPESIPYVTENPQGPDSRAEFDHHRQAPPSIFDPSTIRTVPLSHTRYPKDGRYSVTGAKAIVGRILKKYRAKYCHRGARGKCYAWGTQSILTPKKSGLKMTREERARDNARGAWQTSEFWHIEAGENPKGLKPEYGPSWLAAVPFADLKRLWAELGDVPTDEDGKTTEAAFHGWPAGTEVNEIHRWFDEKLPGGLGPALKRGVLENPGHSIRTRTDNDGKAVARCTCGDWTGTPQETMRDAIREFSIDHLGGLDEARRQLDVARNTVTSFFQALSNPSTCTICGKAAYIQCTKCNVGVCIQDSETHRSQMHARPNDFGVAHDAMVRAREAARAAKRKLAGANPGGIPSAGKCPECGSTKTQGPSYPGDWNDCLACGHSWESAGKNPASHTAPPCEACLAAYKMGGEGNWEDAQREHARQMRRAGKNPEEAWKRMSVGSCKRCGEGHHLVDGLCHDCRQAEAGKNPSTTSAKCLSYWHAFPYPKDPRCPDCGWDKANSYPPPGWKSDRNPTKSQARATAERAHEKDERARVHETASVPGGYSAYVDGERGKAGVAKRKAAAFADKVRGRGGMARVVPVKGGYAAYVVVHYRTRRPKAAKKERRAPKEKAPKARAPPAPTEPLEPVKPPPAPPETISDESLLSKAVESATEKASATTEGMTEEEALALAAKEFEGMSE